MLTGRQATMSVVHPKALLPAQLCKHGCILVLPPRCTNRIAITSLTQPPAAKLFEPDQPYLAHTYTYILAGLCGCSIPAQHQESLNSAAICTLSSATMMSSPEKFMQFSVPRHSGSLRSTALCTLRQACLTYMYMIIVPVEAPCSQLGKYRA